MMTTEKIEINFYDNIQITNDIYNRCQFMEISTFFFSFAGLGMAIIEYELRYFFIYGDYLEGIDPSLVPPPLGMTPERNYPLMILLGMNLFASFMTCFCIVSRYLLLHKWKIQKKLLVSSDTLVTTHQY